MNEQPFSQKAINYVKFVTSGIPKIILDLKVPKLQQKE